MVATRFKRSMKNTKARPTTIIALALTSWATAMAQFAPDPTLALDEITVTATRIAQPVSDVPASVSVIRLNDLLNPVASLADLARSEPGVSAPASFGATGNAPRNFPTTRSFNIRGIDGNRVLIQVDGVRQPERGEAGILADLLGDELVEGEAVAEGRLTRMRCSGKEALSGMVIAVDAGVGESGERGKLVAVFGQ
jgi:hemoglobin/transferrin/lactoferrin receptor protein